MQVSPHTGRSKNRTQILLSALHRAASGQQGDARSDLVATLQEGCHPFILPFGRKACPLRTESYRSEVYLTHRATHQRPRNSKDQSGRHKRIRQQRDPLLTKATQEVFTFDKVAKPLPMAKYPEDRYYGTKWRRAGSGSVSSNRQLISGRRQQVEYVEVSIRRHHNTHSAGEVSCSGPGLQVWSICSEWDQDLCASLRRECCESH
jgi:hypothetical protein